MNFSISKNKIAKYSLFISSILLILLCWIIISNYYQNEMIFPSIKNIIEAFFDIFKNLNNLQAIGFTFYRVICTVVCSFIISCLIIGLYILIPDSIHFFKPIIQIMRSTPLAIISIFIFILIGDKLGPYIITILMIIPVTIEGMLTAVDEVNHDIIDELKLLKGSTIKKIIYIYLPIIKPYLIMTLVQTLGMSFKVMIMGEYICQTNHSIGKTLYAIKANLEMDSLIAYGILIIIIVSILELIILKMKKRA